MHLLATCCLLTALATPLDGASSFASPYPAWEPLLPDPRQSLEIDRTRLRRDRGFVEVWVRNRGRPEAVAREFEAAGVDPERTARVRREFDRSEHLWSFYCADGTHALGYSAYYAVDGSLIQEFRVPLRTYWPVQADTVGRRLMQAACGASRIAGTEDDPTAGRDGDADDSDSLGAGDIGSRDGASDAGDAGAPPSVERPARSADPRH